MENELDIIGLQIRQRRLNERIEEHLEHIESRIRKEPGYRLYVLPELSAVGYSDQIFSNISTIAESIDGAIASFFKKLATELNIFICYGFMRRQKNDNHQEIFTICQAVVNNNGVTILAYDKMHLANFGDSSETAYGCTPGTELGFFEIDSFKIGVTICYDLRFPEVFRALAWDHKCDAVLHCSAFSRDSTFQTLAPFTTTRAVENGVYLMSVNYAGDYFGESAVIPPWLGFVPGLDGSLELERAGCAEESLKLMVKKDVIRAVREAYPYEKNLNVVLKNKLN